jgi:hypothetical protein
MWWRSGARRSSQGPIESYCSETVWSWVRQRLPALHRGVSWQTFDSALGGDGCGTKPESSDVAADADPNTGSRHDTTKVKVSRAGFTVGGTILSRR